MKRSLSIIYGPKNSLMILLFYPMISNFRLDFDKKMFVNGFTDMEVEEYLPDESWKGEFGTPVNYLPEEIKAILKHEEI